MNTYIIGPCSLENYELSYKVLSTVYPYVKDKNFYFKGSFDKANRSSITGKRGPGLEEGLEIFSQLKKDFPGLKVTTDVHETVQVEKLADTIDLIQIPAFLCRQTDLLVESARFFDEVNIKKGQFLAPWDVKGILSKCTDAKEVWITERGTSFGYNSLVVDYTGLMYMLDSLNCDIVFDVTHSVQKPGGHGTSSGGNRDYVPGLARAGSALGVRNFFLEVHHDPDNAPSDGPNALHLKDFEKVVDEIHRYSYTG